MLAEKLVAQSRIRVLIIDDDAALRENLRQALAQAEGFEVVAAIGSLAEARSLDQRECDVVLLDLGLTDGDGMSLVAELKARAHSPRILVVTVFADEASVIRALEGGADGYILKDSPTAELLASVRRAHDGEAPISARAAAHLLRRIRRGGEMARRTDKPVELSRREIELLEHLARGLSYKEAARRMDLSPHTVSEYVGSIYRKLSVRSKAEAVYEALHWGLLSRTE